MWAKWFGDLDRVTTSVAKVTTVAPMYILSHLNEHFALSLNSLDTSEGFTKLWRHFGKNHKPTDLYQPWRYFHNVFESENTWKIKFMENLRAWGYLHRNAVRTSWNWLIISKCISASIENFSRSLGLKTAGYKEPSYVLLMILLKDAS